MRKLSIIALVLALFTGLSFSQYKEIPKETKTKYKSGGLILGFINPKNFSINHSVNMSFMTGGSSSVSLTSYTATLNYQLLKNMNISADVTMQYSPYASLGSSNPALNKDFQNSFNGINLSRVSLDYQPFKNMFITVDYINLKGNPYYNEYNDNYNPYWFNR